MMKHRLSITLLVILTLLSLTACNVGTPVSDEYMKFDIEEYLVKEELDFSVQGMYMYAQLIDNYELLYDDEGIFYYDKNGTKIEVVVIISENEIVKIGGVAD